MIGILQMRTTINSYIIPNAAILIDNGILDVAPASYTQRWNSLHLCYIDVGDGLEVIITHHVSIDHCCAVTNPRTNSHHAFLKPRCVDDAAFGEHSLLQCAGYLPRRKHPCTCVD